MGSGGPRRVPANSRFGRGRRADLEVRLGECRGQGSVDRPFDCMIYIFNSKEG